VILITNQEKAKYFGHLENNVRYCPYLGLEAEMKLTAIPLAQRPNGRETQTDAKSPLFAQIPQRLIRNQLISRSARLLYGVYHSFAQDKKLSDKPTTFVSQETLAKIMGCTIQSVSSWQKELVRAGWIHVRRRGFKSNLTTLYPEPKRNN
jgi:hypothetical protein